MESVVFYRYDSILPGQNARRRFRSALHVPDDNIHKQTLKTKSHPESNESEK